MSPTAVRIAGTIESPIHGHSGILAPFMLFLWPLVRCTQSIWDEHTTDGHDTKIGTEHGGAGYKTFGQKSRRAKSVFRPRTSCTVLVYQCSQFAVHHVSDPRARDGAVAGGVVTTNPPLNREYLNERPGCAALFGVLQGHRNQAPLSSPVLGSSGLRADARLSRALFTGRKRGRMLMMLGITRLDPSAIAGSAPESYHIALLPTNTGVTAATRAWTLLGRSCACSSISVLGPGLVSASRRPGRPLASVGLLLVVPTQLSPFCRSVSGLLADGRWKPKR